MMRVLHLLGRTPDFQAERGAAALSQLPAADFQIIRKTVGPGGDYRHSLFALLPAASREIRAFDLVHAWDAQGLSAAVCSRAGRILYSPSDFNIPAGVWRSPGWGSSPWMRVACSSATQQRFVLNRGMPADRVFLVRPGIDPARFARPRAVPLRAELGFSQSDFVLLAPGESTRSADHRTAIWATSILHVLDSSYRIVLWGRGPEVAACERLAAKLGQPDLLCIAERKMGGRLDFEELLPIADAAIFAPAAPTPPLPIALCAAARLPMVAGVNPLLDELLRGDQRAVRVECPSPRLLAQSVMELRMAATARNMDGVQKNVTRNSGPAKPGSSTDSMARFLNSYAKIYAQIAAE